MPDQIVLTETDASDSNVVVVDGICYARIGTTDAAATPGVVVQCRLRNCAECADRPPATCPAGLAAFYQITSGLGSINCATCNSSAAPPWAGKFGAGSNCNWTMYRGPSGSEGSLNGKALNPAATRLYLQPGCSWTVEVRCFKLGIGQVMWAGTKTGQSPAGVYTRLTGTMAGCSAGPSTVEIAAV